MLDFDDTSRFPEPSRFDRPRHLSMLPVQESPFVQLPVKSGSEAAFLLIDEKQLAKGPFKGALILPMFAVDGCSYKGAHVVPELESSFRMHMLKSGDEYDFVIRPEDPPNIELWRADDVGVGLFVCDREGQRVQVSCNNLFIAVLLP